jgi:hypothetical protein
MNHQQLYIRLRNGTWMCFTGTEKYVRACAKKADFLRPTSINFINSSAEMKRMYGDGFDSTKVIKID